MIGEAVDAALLVADALAVWVLVGAVVGTSVVYAAVVGGWLIWRGVRRAVSAAIPRRGPSVASGAPQDPSWVSVDAGGAPDAVDGRTGIPAALAPPEPHAAPPRTDSLPPLAAEQPASDSSPAAKPQRRSGPPLRPTPSWARKDAA